MYKKINFMKGCSKMISIAIDGPAGAGKSSIARAAAEKLHYIYVDTGALYRTIGLAAARNNTDIENADAVSELLTKIDIRLVFLDGEQHVLLNDEDVSTEIRTEQASMMASKVSAIPAVRAYLLDTQRDFAKTDNILMDGRDIGTVVLPNANVKIFLTASPEIRAKRRVAQLAEKGIESDYDEVLKDIIQRDYNDSHREIAPLKPAKDAILFDTSDTTLEQAVDKLVKIIEEKIR